MSEAPGGVRKRSFETPSGVVVGLADDEVVKVLGVPYATAERFAAPSPVGPRTEPLRAFDRSPSAPQLHSALLSRLIGDDDLGQDERCQRLSVTLPADADEGQRLPVMVWIHGGSYVSGAGDLEVYDPRSLVTEQRVVVVSITYRLGVLGFLGDGDATPANLGLLDQLAALHWVRDNIAAFGGDPDAVTLFGQSAGGDAIAHLMISDGAEGLFHRAVVQSAPLGITDGRSAMTKAMLAAVGEPSRTAPADDLLALQGVAEKAARRFGLPGGMPFGVQYGLPPVPAEAAREAAWRRVARDVDVLVGCTSEEAALLTAAVPLLTRLFETPLVGGPISRRVVAWLTRRIYDAPARAFAARHTQAGGRAIRYRMTWRPEGSPLGACHVTDVPLLLGTRAAWEHAPLLGRASWADIDRRGRAVRRIWAEFARTGAPSLEARDAARDTITFPED